MRAQLVHLTGPLRGRTRTYAGQRVLVGRGPDADVRFDGSPAVTDRHAEIEFDPKGCAFHLRPLDGQVFVNRREVHEVVLEDGDLVEFGEDGPRARFRTWMPDGAVCKPVRHMLRDARDVGNESGPAGFSSSMARDLLEHATLQLKIGVPAVLLLLAGVAFAVGRYTSTRNASASGADDVEAAQIAAEYEAEIRALRAEIEKLRERQEFSRDEVAVLRDELERRGEALDRLQRRGVAVARVHDTYSRGVCLIHGAYGFRLPGKSDKFVTEPTGARLRVEYTGTGFLVSRDGIVVTNRHVTMPWEFDDQAKSLVQVGFRPEMFEFTATFPGDAAPRAVDRSTVRTRKADRLDVSSFRVTVGDEMPTLELSTEHPSRFRGGPVLVVGYSTGVNALLAKADRRVVEAVTDGSPTLGEVIQRLARHGAIRPSITSGVLGEVGEEKLVYDAETTSGGSGGPVFNADGRVIGVNFAILRGFGGSNLGVPIRFVTEVVE